MKYIQRAFDSAVRNLSDENYDQSLAFCRHWLEIAQAYSQIPSDLTFDAILAHRALGPGHENLIFPTAHLILRFASDLESDNILSPHAAGLRSRVCARILQEFFDADLGGAKGQWTITNTFYMDANLIAHYANLGYMEVAIRNHILQSLISHPTLHGHQLWVLYILFKIAGATFEAYADPTVVDRCFELLKGYTWSELIRVSAFSVKGATFELK